ncbi:Arogenate dehydratase prephenate dehydratase 2 [Musa troglodytarum]|uniref:Arogenate dehydratase n=1 Tax=Musa troglodytarum TaxID=320322 RepID=A0A9E7GEQ8_9LILI|nr:Arogenate dehydratase prephenate dehydratase 2 [Musa troglodytarum]
MASNHDGVFVASNGCINGAGALELRASPDETLPNVAGPKSVSDVSGSANGYRLRVAYQGLPGAYSEAAAAKAYRDCEPVPCELFETAFDALAQCENTLAKIGVVREAVDDTAGAAKFIATHKLQDAGAVASSLAAEIYGLDILALDIQDDPDNITRFLMLAREPIIPVTHKPFKTSIVFSLEEGPGVLFKALAVFALRNINLTKIESRPKRTKPLRITDNGSNGRLKYFDYLFFVDFEASMASPNAQNALGHLKELATFLRVLGSYPRDMSEA